MKKKLIMLTIALSIGTTGCSNTNDLKAVNDGKGIHIIKEDADRVDQIRDRVQGNATGIYKVNNLGIGKYKVEISMEEYNDGKLKESQDIISYEVDIKDNTDTLYVGINKNNDSNNLTFDVSDSKGSVTSGKFNLGDEEEGYSWAMLENNGEEVHKIQLNKDLSIASFSIGKNDRTYGISVGDYTKQSEYNFDGEVNVKDVVVYLKISKI